MNDDDLLHALAEEALREREEERAGLDERWDRLAAGELSAAGEAELRALAAGSPAAREAYAAFRPLGAELRQRMVQAIQAQSAAAPELTAAAPAAGRILPMRRRAAWLGGALAAAAAVAATLVLPLVVEAPLPAYEVVVLEGGTAALRGGPAAAAVNPRAPVYRLLPDSPLKIEVRPQTPVGDPIEAQWFAARQGEEPRPLPAAARQLSKSGAALLQGRAGTDLHLGQGLWSLWVMVGRAGDLPGASVLRADGAAAPGWTRRTKDWIAWRVAQLRVETGARGH